ncbi:MAG: diaminopimelate decarboxylase [Clostridia bacterium]|nr:diaminopimelate decarboxylase [Clostridia bacterium]
MICKNLSVNEKGHLTFAGQDTVELAKQYQTPLYLMDEERIRENCRTYIEAFKKYFNNSSYPIFASKANSFKRIYEIVNEEGMGCDVVSLGEMYTAIKAGLPLEKAFFHSNNKTDEDIEYAIQNSIGHFVVDNAEELYKINEIANKYKIRQKILLRITPGIDTHTYEAVNTGKVDSKFGSAIETGQAEEITKQALELENIILDGFHCHVGSQVFDSDTFIRSADIMIEFMSDMGKKYSFKPNILNLGGGYGVRYVESDPEINIDENIRQVSEKIKEICKKYSTEMPQVVMEPGRSIVADAGMTLYTVGTIKKIPEYKNYVSIDGGMTDNPRYALYKSPYTIYIANKMNEERDFECSLVGRCCESGDIIQENIMLPSSVERYDVAAVLTTGAYNYSMASNYNKIPKPPIVMLNKGKSYVAVKRESLEDLVKNDI